MGSRELTALAPITDTLPELSASDYGDVRAWDAEIVEAGAAFDAYTGQRLALIRDRLTSGPNLASGMWTRYLAARGLNESTARYRIAAATGQPWSRRPAPIVSGDRLPDSDRVERSRRAVPDIAGRAAALLLRDDAGDLSVDDLVGALAERADRERRDLDTLLATVRGWAVVLRAAGSPEYWDDGGEPDGASGRIVEAATPEGWTEAEQSYEAEWEAIERAASNAGDVPATHFQWPVRR